MLLIGPLRIRIALVCHTEIASGREDKVYGGRKEDEKVGINELVIEIYVGMPETVQEKLQNERKIDQRCDFVTSPFLLSSSK